MEAILARLGSDDGLPVDAILEADANRAAMVPLILRAIDRPADNESTRNVLFFAFHLLGQWRETSAYRPLAAFLRRPTDDIEPILGDATTETSHRVMAAVFDGDPEPLYEIILDPRADEFIRSCMFGALVILALRGALPREETARFLRSCYADLQPQEECAVWEGWQAAIARLGLRELQPLVKQAFKRGFIDPSMLAFEDFEADLQLYIDEPDAGPDDDEPFGDTIEELSSWAGFRPDKIDADDDPWDAEADADWPPTPVINPFRNVGRNDPCPCGSGKKFKKCCLNADRPSEPSPALQAVDRRREGRDDARAVLAPANATIPDYDPFTEPDPQRWLALGEQQRIDLVEAYHRRAKIHPPRAEVHAVIHVVVENQIADPELPVRRIAQRLMSEGLDRHQAVHAIGSVLAGYINDLAREAKSERERGDVESDADPNQAYFAELESLTAEEWLRSG
jgi:hypothetical protein